MPDGTTTNVDLLSARSSAIHLRVITQEIPQPSVTKPSLENNCPKFNSNLPGLNELTHWGRVTHICLSNLTIIVSDNGLSPGRRQAIIWTNAGILLIGPLGTNLSEILIGIQIFSFKKMHLKMASAKWRPLCLGLNVLKRLLHMDLKTPGWNHEIVSSKTSNVSGTPLLKIKAGMPLITSFNDEVLEAQ